MGGDCSSVCLTHSSLLILCDARGMLPGWLLCGYWCFFNFIFQYKEGGFINSLRKLQPQNCA